MNIWDIHDFNSKIRYLFFLLFNSFEISFRCDIVLFFRFTFTYSAISISQRYYFLFSLFHFFKTCSHSHREIRINTHAIGTKRNVNTKPSLCLAVAALRRTLNVQAVTINSAQPDFDIAFSNCSCSVMRGHFS